MELMQEFGEDSYCLTALGATFDQYGDTYAANIQYLLSTCPIKEVRILQSTDCNFIIQNFSAGQDKIGLQTEKTFASSYREIVKKPVVSISEFDRKLEMAEINLSRQMTFVCQLINDLNNTSTKRSIKGAIYGEGKTLADRKIIQKFKEHESV